MSDKQQADVGDWDTDFPADEKKNDGDRTPLNFMKFNGPGDYTIRLVGNHVKFHRHWSPFKERVITHPNYKPDDPAWEAGFWPKTTYAIHVIDRSDGQLKILEKGTSLFKQFGRYKTVNDVNPAGMEGPDWVITVEGSGLNTKYSATAKVKASPFTDEEKEMIRANKAPLKDIYATTPLEKIQELWEALPDDAKVPPKRDKDDTKTPPAKTAAIEESMDDAPAEKEASAGDDGGDDLFGDGDETSF